MVLCVGRVPLVAVWLKPSCRRRTSTPPSEVEEINNQKLFFSHMQMQRLSVVLHTAVAWQTVNELACGESGILHGAECIAVLNGVA